MLFNITKLLFYFQLILFSSPGKGSACFFGEYQYQGVTHSEKYQLPPEKKALACEIRQNIDEKKIGKSFDENRAQIMRTIIAILQEPKCSEQASLLEEHLDKLKHHQDDFDFQVASNMKKLARDKGQVDIQREYAHLGHMNNTCNGQYNRTTSLLDLDLINRLHSVKRSVQVSKEGELVEDCSEVSASGSAELKNFRVSLKKAEGENFIFGFDPYQVPDQVKISEDGETIFDSGCFGSGEKKSGPVTIPLSQLSKSRVLDISVIWNCSKSDGSGSSAWEFFLQCQQPAKANPCSLKEELIELLKRELQILKQFMDINNHQRECFTYLYDDILTYLLKAGVVRPDDKSVRDGYCSFMNKECNQKREERQKSEAQGGVVPLR